MPRPLKVEWFESASMSIDPRAATRPAWSAGVTRDEERRNRLNPGNLSEEVVDGLARRAVNVLACEDRHARRHVTGFLLQAGRGDHDRLERRDVVGRLRRRRGGGQ